MQKEQQSVKRVVNTTTKFTVRTFRAKSRKRLRGLLNATLVVFWRQVMPDTPHLHLLLLVGFLLREKTSLLGCKVLELLKLRRCEKRLAI
jgi:hypothetical protein